MSQAGNYSLTTPSSIQRIIQSQITTRNTALNTNNTIPNDGSTPQISEGEQYLSVSITPNLAAHQLVIEGQVSLLTTDISTVAIFRDATADAIYAAQQNTNNSLQVVTFQVTVSAASTNPTTFTMRVGANSASTTAGGGTPVDIAFLKVTETNF